MRTKLIAIAVLGVLTTGIAGQAVARDDFEQRRDEWRRQQQLDRDRDRRDRDRRGVDRQQQRDKEKAWYWQEREAKDKLGTPPRR